MRPRSRARRSTLAASAGPRISGKSASTWMRTGAILLVEQARERRDDGAAARALDRAHHVGDHRDQVLALPVTHHPYVVRAGVQGLGDRAERLAGLGLDPEANHLVPVELVVGERREVA